MLALKLALTEKEDSYDALNKSSSTRGITLFKITSPAFVLMDQTFITVTNHCGDHHVRSRGRGCHRRTLTLLRLLLSRLTLATRSSLQGGNGCTHWVRDILGQRGAQQDCQPTRCFQPRFAKRSWPATVCWSHSSLSFCTLTFPSSLKGLMRAT